MGFTRSERDVKIIQKLSDYPNVEEGISSEKLKESFDKGSVMLQEDINKLQEELESQESALFLGAKPLDETDTSENDVQSKLEYILNQIKGVSQGAIPDGSITENKLVVDYANLLAKKNGVLQEGLNAEKVGGFLISEIFKIGNYSGTSSVTSTKTQIIDVGFKPRFLVIVGGRDLAISINGVGIHSSGSSSTGNEEITSELLDMLENGFSVTNIRLNRNGIDYTYVAFR